MNSLYFDFFKQVTRGIVSHDIPFKPELSIVAQSEWVGGWGGVILYYMLFNLT